MKADEVFITSTTRGVVPATRIDDRAIGNGAPGPVTRALGLAYNRKAQALTRESAKLKA
jgi:branched-subunit amino acid aminotransferase/4-amino-4-deoxychorismate lyase